MVDSISQLRFAAEFVVFIVAFAGLFLAVRPNAIDPSSTTRVLFGAGFLAEGAAAFLYGAFLVEDFHQPALAGLRAVGLLLLVIATIRWRVERLARLLLAVAIVALIISEVWLLAGGGRAGDVARLVGGLILGAALIRSGRHSIPARIGTSVAALLLVVVLAVSVAVSVVVDRNVVDSAFARYRSRAVSEASTTRQAATDQLTSAKVFAGSLSTDRTGAAPALATWITGNGTPEARATVESLLTDLTASVGVKDPVLYVSPRQLEVAVGQPLDPSTQLALAGSDVVTQAAGPGGGPRQSVAVVAHRAFAIAAYPVQPVGAGKSAGAIVVAHPLDHTFLQVLVDTAGEPLGLALVDGDRVLASAGAQPAAATLRSEARGAMERGTGGSRTAGGRFVVSEPIMGADGAPRAALVLSAPTSAIDRTRRDLFRSLFLVAMGVTLVALVLAVVAGERIGGGLRRLTAAAARIRAGDLGSRSGITSPDELGVLADSFDSMAGSLQTMTDDLRRSAADEARLRVRLEAVVSGMGEALVAVDPAGKITECNPAASMLLGWERADALGRSLAEVVPVVEGVTPVLDDGDVARAGESRVRTADGREVPVALSVGPLADADGSTAGSVVVLRDLRREQEIEQLKTEFLSNISHELRTPLTPIKGYADMLATRKLDAAQSVRFAREITDGVTQLERVIGQLVNFATAAAGRLDLVPVPSSPGALIGRALERWRPRAGAEHRLSRQIAKRTPEVLVDPVAIGQALDELLDNAVKYAPDGGSIVVSARPVAADDGGAGRRLGGPPASADLDGRDGTAGPGGMVRISVADEGIGVSPDRMAALITEFAQGDGSATRRFSGLGLGLALVDRIVRAHGGWVECESEVGRGSTFSLVVPDASNWSDADDSSASGHPSPDLQRADRA